MRGSSSESISGKPPSDSASAVACLTPEYKKTILSMAYLALATFVVCYATAVAHQRAPDRALSPPLPDLVFDMTPFNHWGILATEVCTIILMLTLVIIGGVFHKHRSIITRRYCTIMGTVYLIRLVTILSTSLPITSPLQECSPKDFDTVGKKLQLAFTIWSKSGFRLNGVKVCGDYMFSGHITTLTLSSLFVVEYSPKRFLILHIVSYTMNIMGMIFIVIGRGHYTIDVVVAYVVATLTFSHYHTLTDLHVARGGNGVRFFPLLAYFERNVLASIPNAYEFPSLSKLRNGGKQRQKNYI